MTASAFAADLEVINGKYAQIAELEKEIDVIVAAAAAKWVADRYPDAAVIAFDEDTQTGYLTLLHIEDETGNPIAEANGLSSQLALLEIACKLSEQAANNVLQANGYHQHLVIADHHR